MPETVKMTQVCHTYSVRELAIALGLSPQPDEWVVIEVDAELDTVDVMIRRREAS